MGANLVVASKSDTMQDCMAKMVARDIRHLPVVDEDEGQVCCGREEQVGVRGAIRGGGRTGVAATVLKRRLCVPHPHLGMVGLKQEVAQKPLSLRMRRARRTPGLRGRPWSQIVL